MTYGRQLIAVVSACLLTSAHSFSAEPAPLKGMRAILFHAPTMPHIVRVTGFDEANALYGSVTKGFFSGKQLNRDKLKGRPCIAIDAVRAGSAPYVPDSELVPYYADYRYWFYPAVGDEPAVFMTGHEVPTALLQTFIDAGVPVQLPRGTSGRCQWETQLSGR